VQILAFWVGVILLKCSKALQKDCSLKRQVSYATFVKFSKDMDTFENFFNKTFSECAAPSLLNQNISSSPESNVTNGGELHCPRSETIGIKTDGALKTIQVTEGENLESVYQRYREFYGECSDIHKNLLLENIFRSNLTTAFNYCPVDDFHVFHVGGTKVQFEVKQGDPIAPILATLCTEHRCCTKGCHCVALVHEKIAQTDIYSVNVEDGHFVKTSTNILEVDICYPKLPHFWLRCFQGYPERIFFPS
jgi:hypothetical protein